MAAPKPMPKPKQPSAIKKITCKIFHWALLALVVIKRPPAIKKIPCKGRMDSYDRQKKRFLKDPLYKTPENLREGTNAFAGDIYRKVGDQWRAKKFDNWVQEILEDISLDAVLSDKKRIVWRGLRDVDPESTLAMAQEGKIIPDFPPTSTSSNQSVGVGYGRKGDDVEMLMKITVPKGIPIVVHNADEMEVLLEQRFRLRIDRIDLDVPLREDSKELGIVRKVIQATVFPEKGK